MDENKVMEGINEGMVEGIASEGISNSKGKGIAIAVGAVVIAAGVGAVTYFMKKRRDNKDIAEGNPIIDSEMNENNDSEL